MALIQPAKIRRMIGETSDSRVEAESGFMCFVNGAQIIGVALRHDRVDAALPERDEDLLCNRQIAPELWDNECADNPFRRQASLHWIPRPSAFVAVLGRAMRLPSLDYARRVGGCSLNV